jgi:hypothetical protein
MIADDFRKLALAIPTAEERAHMNHPDFRLGGKIFATLGAPDDAWGMVNLTPAQQRSFMRKAPTVFEPCNGAWGRQGSTKVHLASATAGMVSTALDLAAKKVMTRRK